IKGTIPPSRGPCTQRGCRLLRLATTCTSSETKALSRHKASPCGSFRPVSRVGLTLTTRGTAISDEDGLIRGRCEGSVDACRAGAFRDHGHLFSTVFRRTYWVDRRQTGDYPSTMQFCLPVVDAIS